MMPNSINFNEFLRCGCPECVRVKELRDEDELSECDGCGHIFPVDDLERRDDPFSERYLCKLCAHNRAFSK